jgi:hypothetical protein
MIYFILILCFIFCIFYVYLQYVPNNYLFYYLKSYKPINEFINNPKILICMLSIDRDADIAQKVYDKIIISNNNFKLQFPKATIDMIVITRIIDSQIINFWNNKAKIITVDNYTIDYDKRHNHDAIVKKSNILIKYAQYHMYSHVFFVESDIGLNYDTLTKLYNCLSIQNDHKGAHVALSCGIIPWCNKCIAYIPKIMPICVKPYDYKKPFIGLGSSLMATLFDINVFKDVCFNTKTLFGITGQDVGIFNDLFYNRYKVVIIPDMVEHYFNRKNLKF